MQLARPFTFWRVLLQCKSKFNLVSLVQLIRPSIFWRELHPLRSRLVRAVQPARPSRFWRASHSPRSKFLNFVELARPSTFWRDLQPLTLICFNCFSGLSPLRFSNSSEPVKSSDSRLLNSANGPVEPRTIPRRVMDFFKFAAGSQASGAYAITPSSA